MRSAECFCAHEKTAPGSGPFFQRGVGRTTQDSLRRAAPLKERLGSMGREQKRIERMYGLFLVHGKKHLLGQIPNAGRMLPPSRESLSGQGFPASMECDHRVAVTAPQSAEICTCSAGVGVHNALTMRSKFNGQSRGGGDRQGLRRGRRKLASWGVVGRGYYPVVMVGEVQYLCVQSQLPAL